MRHKVTGVMYHIHQQQQSLPTSYRGTFYFGIIERVIISSAHFDSAILFELLVYKSYDPQKRCLTYMSLLDTQNYVHCK